MLMTTPPYHPPTHHRALKLHVAFQSQIHHNLLTLSPATLLTRLPPHTEPFLAHLRHHVLTIPSFPSLDHIHPLPFQPPHQHILLAHLFHHHEYKCLVPGLHFPTLVLLVHHLTTRMHPVPPQATTFFPRPSHFADNTLPSYTATQSATFPSQDRAALPTLADHVNIDADHL